MTFEELCKDFNVRRPQGEPTAYIPFFNTKWENGADSINDLLRRGLRELGFDYLNDFNGVVWFLYYDAWERCIAEVKDNMVHFYMCKFQG